MFKPTEALQNTLDKNGLAQPGQPADEGQGDNGSDSPEGDG